MSGGGGVRVTFWGTRGSIAKAGPTTLRYGGNTSCIEIRTDAGTLIIIDCGTGAHGLGSHLAREAAGRPIDGHILISHTHWDHIQGLPFFQPLFSPANSWQIYGPTGLGTSLGETLSGQMQYSYFPVTIDQMGGLIHYHDLVEGCFEIDDVRVTTHYLNHPALTLGYRLEADGATVVYASDHEPHHRELAHGGDIGCNRHDDAHATFVRGADLLIHDAQYLASEYDAKEGWGHSTVEYVVDVARHARVETVALYHHDPDRSDAEVDDALDLARAHGASVGFEGEIIAAAEGLTVELAGDPSTGEPVAADGRAATGAPAIDSAHRSILIAVHSPEIAATVRDAAESEQIECWESTDHDRILDIAREREPAIVVLEDHADDARDLTELTDSIHDLERASGGRVNVVVIGGSGVRPALHGETTFLEWLAWPSSPAYVRTKLRAWLLRRACRWQHAIVPQEEPQRLATLESLSVLDTDPEERFDQITAAASQLLDMPIALVSLVDADRQWFKSRHGLDATETPRDMAFCAHAILGDEVFQVPDALADDRFAENPLVAGDPRVRFYAGVPLKMSDGTRAGTLCVIDYRPRRLDDVQLAELRRLGGLVALELESG